MSTRQRKEVDARIREVGIAKAEQELGVAGILFTYRCSIACRHCLFGCRGRRPDVAMPSEKCARYLEQLHELGRLVHIAGGEVMLYWNELALALALAKERGAEPHFIETNCSFATDDRIVIERLEYFKRYGVKGIYLSADPYHQEFVPPERFIRTREIARATFGCANVIAPGQPDEEIRKMAEIARNERKLADYVRANARSLMLVGSAYAELGRYLDESPVEELLLQERGWGPRRYTARHCGPDFDAKMMPEVHIDPYDNIQTNCGVILGNAAATPVAEVMARGPGEANFASRILAREGPLGLVEYARERHGFDAPKCERQKCALCYVTRRFLRPFHPDVFGPEEVYSA